MRQVYGKQALTTLKLPKLETVGSDLWVRARPRPRSADRARRRAYRVEPALPLSCWRVAMRASGDW